MKYLFVFLICLSSLIPSSASDSIWHPHLAKYAIGFSPSAFLNEYSGIQISQDIRLRDNLNLSIETAYLYQNNNINDNNNNVDNLNFWGYRVKPGIEFTSKMNHGLAVSMGINGLIRYTSDHRYQTLSFDGFTQKIPYEETRLLIGGEITYRIIINITERLFMEFGNGLGLGNLEQKEFGRIRSNNDLFLGDFFYSSPGNYPYPIISTNLNFSYRLLLHKKKTKKSKSKSNTRKKKRRKRR